LDRIPPLTWSSSGRSHVGGVRKVNEDSLLDRPDLGLWAVADGMGGHQCGDVASQSVVEALNKLPRASSLAECSAQLEHELRAVNLRLRQMAEQQGPGNLIGTTAVALAINGDQYLCAWVGDSRAYLLRNQQLVQISRDHTHVAELVDHGLISAEEAEKHPMANVLTRAVGAHDDITLDETRGALQAGDLFLLCSDGLTKELNNTEIAAMLSGPNPEEISRALIHATLVRGARDNVSVVLVRIEALEPTLIAR
jgi:serine/threonine protein phosphatase PrpC